ncbi:Na+/H+ antiporter subunit E [Desulfobulbus alkaliphilus]|uniref:Na+/H+ antiporter subunit E n=1 Tax=Desulfobulbus alkaliphilus TaxID=869814 RepID=UPI001964E8A2|nr:Na+/H+ antiporter subunit E [Desulfobulbus alkaliphilus]MBM9535688.1 Na+/H+ antiporter subunit E [Desulfobulbus alkaliphilus]
MHLEKIPRINRNSRHGHKLLAVLIRTALLVVIWWVLTENQGGWVFGILSALMIACCSLLLTPPATHRLRVHRLPGFFLFFLVQSLRAGWDVAVRTVRPSLPLQPAILSVPLMLPAGAPTWWLMLVVSLLPGTLSAHLDGRTLELHCLDEGLDVVADVREAERHLALLFGQIPSSVAAS